MYELQVFSFLVNWAQSFNFLPTADDFADDFADDDGKMPRVRKEKCATIDDFHSNEMFLSTFRSRTRVPEYLSTRVLL